MPSKTAYFAILFIGLSIAVIFAGFKITNIATPEINSITSLSGGGFEVNYTTSSYANYGKVFDPVVTFDVETPKGIKKMDFILDSGAVVSAMPNRELETFNLNFEDLQRIVVKGHGSTFFAYMSDITINIDGNTKQIPVLFTNSDVGSKVLGRRGFFDQYNVEFNSQRQKIIIKEF